MIYPYPVRQWFGSDREYESIVKGALFTEIMESQEIIKRTYSGVHRCAFAYVNLYYPKATIDQFLVGVYLPPNDSDDRKLSNYGERVKITLHSTCNAPAEVWCGSVIQAIKGYVDAGFASQIFAKQPYKTDGMFEAIHKVKA